jgi:hypothetical protein
MNSKLFKWLNLNYAKKPILIGQQLTLSFNANIGVITMKTLREQLDENTHVGGMAIAILGFGVLYDSRETLLFRKYCDNIEALTHLDAISVVNAYMKYLQAQLNA